MSDKNNQNLNAVWADTIQLPVTIPSTALEKEKLQWESQNGSAITISRESTSQHRDLVIRIHSSPTQYVG